MRKLYVVVSKNGRYNPSLSLSLSHVCLFLIKRKIKFCQKMVDIIKFWKTISLSVWGTFNESVEWTSSWLWNFIGKHIYNYEKENFMKSHTNNVRLRACVRIMWNRQCENNNFHHFKVINFFLKKKKKLSILSWYMIC